MRRSRTSTCTPRNWCWRPGIPILDRGGYFARVKPQRSYCLAFKVPGTITRPMMISTDSPTRSVRYAPVDDGELLIVGGAGHTVGRETSPSKALDELSSWTRLHYPGAVQTHFWSAQDYSPIDELPYVGPILPNFESIFIATGFNKWGMTNGPPAALALSSRILGGRMDWASAFASWSRHELSGLVTAMQSNLEVGLNLGRGWITRDARGSAAARGRRRRRGQRTARGTWKPDPASTASSAPCHPCARTSVGSSTGTTPTRPGSARCTGRGSRRTARCSKVPQQPI